MNGARIVTLIISIRRRFHKNHSELDKWDFRLIGYVFRKKAIKEIAELNNLSPKTFNARFTHLYRKLGVKRRAELIRLLAEWRHLV